MLVGIEDGTLVGMLDGTVDGSLVGTGHLLVYLQAEMKDVDVQALY